MIRALYTRRLLTATQHLEAHFGNRVPWLQVMNLLRPVTVENKNKPIAVFANWCESRLVVLEAFGLLASAAL